MIVDLTDTGPWPREFNLTIESKDVELGTANARLVGVVKARGSVEIRAGWFEVDGYIEGKAEIDCSRCLEPVARGISIPFNVRFVKPEEVGEAHEREIDTGDLDSSEIENDQIDLKEVIREQILLDLPEQVFCKEDCKGLCPKCGANRNLIDCGCEDEDIDPRWAALKDLK